MGRCSLLYLKNGGEAKHLFQMQRRAAVDLNTSPFSVILRSAATKDLRVGINQIVIAGPDLSGRGNLYLSCYYNLGCF
jgi:hypothetical protein